MMNFYNGFHKSLVHEALRKGSEIISGRLQISGYLYR
eukprot:UN13751